MNLSVELKPGVRIELRQFPQVTLIAPTVLERTRDTILGLEKWKAGTRRCDVAGEQKAEFLLGVERVSPASRRLRRRRTGGSTSAMFSVVAREEAEALHDSHWAIHQNRQRIL
ncbi:hypothetical protein Taro_013203 [Colocasia esculenta]|uniref:Uncharacterized protein n=1 Tax=Colocasia esculenta TaxID=4460 RepID=A0A843UEY0_COLES|nr:hypothetical protein [Colocasia esculenta]